ncbi:MAG: hypothetical protein JO301_08745 [Chitinophagaceae bacterium]|nr:hypothetical protein [Chitinophagaceae bacterium]
MAKQTKPTIDPEIAAISEVYAALKDLDPDARKRVLDYVSEKFNIVRSTNLVNEEASSERDERPYETAHAPTTEDEFEGISPVAKKWIARSGISAQKLMSIFSLGIDEIDLVSKSVPGNGKASRTRSIFLLKGIAAYLGTGVPRTTYEQIKETCLHYDAWDSPNFAKYVKSFAAEVSGAKDTGYTLTARGISEATNLIKSMTGQD